MFKSLKKKNNKGFTLVELVIVVVILAILVGILAPQYTKYVEKSRKAADASNLENMVTVMKVLAADSTDSVPAGTYTIKINASGTSITPSGDNATLDTTLKGLIDNAAGDNWAQTTLKSKKWSAVTGTNNKNEILAAVTVGADGSVTVKYTPSTLVNEADK